VCLQDLMQIGLVERALAGLVDDRLAVDRAQLRNNVVAGLAAHQDAARRFGRADSHRGLAALDLGVRRVREVRPVALAGMNDQELGGAGEVRR
jgi:hypothetical protein